MNNVAVIPIFINTGITVLPLLAAAVGSIILTLLRPRQLLSLCRKKPWAAFATAVTILAIILCLTTLNASAGRDKKSAAKTTPRTDWVKVALDMLAQEAAGQIPTAATKEAPAQISIFLEHDSSRRSYDGGLSPTNLIRRWSYQPEDTMFLSSPVAAGKRIFVAGCQSGLGNYTGLLACLDESTGKPVWEISEAGDNPLKAFFSSPALTQDGKYLIVGQGLHTDSNCSLLCFDAETGRLRWALPTTLHIESSPAIKGDMVVVGAGAIEDKHGNPTGDAGYVIAARISDGKELWRQPLNDPESSPAIDAEGIVYIGSGNNGNAVAALRSESDQQLRDKNLSRIVWKTPLDLPMTGSITLAGDLVIAGGGNGDFVRSNANAKGLVVAIDRKTGQIRWQQSFGDGALGSIAWHDKTLVCPLRTGEVVAMSMQDGKILWRQRVNDTAPILAGCAFADQRIYAVSNNGYLAVLDANTGKILEKIYLNDQAKPGTGLSVSSPQISGGRIFVGTETGGLQCLVGKTSK